MKKKIKNILITGATSDMAKWLIEKLCLENNNIWAVSRHELKIDAQNLTKIYADLSQKEEIDRIFSDSLKTEFDAVICFQGIAITSPVECLDENELKKQLNISLFSLCTLLRNLKNKIKKDGIIISISSMASFGLFPYIAPYEIAKASADILLNCYEIETGIKTVSIKPGAVKTKFWNYCVNENEKNFPAFSNEYKIIGEFLKDNALKNGNKGVSPEKVSKLIYKILNSKSPKVSYLIGADSYIACFASLFKSRFLFSIIRKILKQRVKKYIYEK